VHLAIYIFRLYEVIILARVLMSWIHVDPYHPVAVWIYRLTEPVLDPIRRILPTDRIGLDLSPVVVIIMIRFLERIIIGTLHSF